MSRYNHPPLFNEQPPVFSQAQYYGQYLYYSGKGMIGSNHTDRNNSYRKVALVTSLCCRDSVDLCTWSISVQEP